jgi:hypothetical protein
LNSSRFPRRITGKHKAKIINSSVVGGVFKIVVVVNVIKVIST